MKTVLILGGSGYLGQFLVQSLTKHYKLDLPTGEGMQQCFDRLGPVDAVINCAAISSPAACEQELDTARALNVPTKLLDALDLHKLVYDGSKANWRETDKCHPVNAYGRTKLEAEQLIQDRWPNHVILRSSIIFGPQSPVPVSRVLFLQFIANGLRQGKPTTFFQDEYRCPIYVKDIVNIAMALIDSQDNLQDRLLNMGGPERLSRLDMAYKTADCWELDRSCIVPALSASVKRGVVSPADISMDSSRLLQQLPSVKLTSLEDALLDIEHGVSSRHNGVNSSKERLGQ
ncbi:MAG: methionine adenosyltransferase 2 subunit beta-like [Trebouxia sp. A1-2]|nr:MAG: methionine adenosyltransferase 2 subunit beta-like [Trebouxia sp. A1-2]